MSKEIKQTTIKIQKAKEKKFFSNKIFIFIKIVLTDNFFVLYLDEFNGTIKRS